MPVLAQCGFPNNEEDPFSIRESVEISVVVSDPETGRTTTTQQYCQEHGDQVLSTLGTLGFITD